MVIYKRQNSNKNLVTHWHTALPNDASMGLINNNNDNSLCPSICGIGYKHFEEITPLTSINFDKHRHLLNTNNNKNNVEIARIVTNNNNNNKYSLISQKINRCYNINNKECEYKTIDYINNKYIPNNWKYNNDANLLDLIKLKFAIKQSNNEYNTLENELLKVSDPDSNNYGNYWTFDEIHEFFKPKEESFKIIKNWLYSFGILDNDIKYLTKNGDFIEVKMNIQQANDLLNTKFCIWKHKETGLLHFFVF